MKIKVLQVIGTLHIGGAETVAMNLYRYIDRSKFEFHYLVYTSIIGEYEQEVLDLGGKVIHMTRDGRNRFCFFKKIVHMMKENHYDIVHSHLLFHNGLVMKAAYKAGIRCRISHSHSTKNKLVSNVLESILQRLYQKISRNQILKYANHFVACGIEAGNFLYGELEFATKGFVLNNGIDCKQYDYDSERRREMRAKLGMEGKFVYGNAAHFIPVKNQQFLLEIFREIKTKQEKAFLVLMGDGEQKEEIEQKAIQMGLEDDVLFTGNIRNVYDMLQAIDLFIMPSKYEGLPVALIEAQAAGLRCIVSNRVTKEADIGGNIRFLSLDKGASYWAKHCIENVNYERRSMCEKVRQLGYDIEQNVKEVEKWYLEISS